MLQSRPQFGYFGALLPQAANGLASLGLVVMSTAALALTSENRSFCLPASVDATVVDAIKDHVSMATLAARKASQVLSNTARVLAIELICACQALELRDGERSTRVAARVRDYVRAPAPFVREGQGLSEAIEKVTLGIVSGGLSAAAEAAIGGSLE
jgi:histidine ammonia-lyase